MWHRLYENATRGTKSIPRFPILSKGGNGLFIHPFPKVDLAASIVSRVVIWFEELPWHKFFDVGFSGSVPLPATRDSALYKLLSRGVQAPDKVWPPRYLSPKTVSALRVFEPGKGPLTPRDIPRVPFFFSRSEKLCISTQPLHNSIWVLKSPIYVNYQETFCFSLRLAT